MFRAAAQAALATPFTPFSTVVQDEVSYMSGVDGNGDVAPNCWWQYEDSFARKWGSAIAGSASGVVTYAFDPTTPWNPADQAMIQAGMALWSAVTNITFVEASDPDSAALLFHFDNNGFAATGTYESPVGPATVGTPYMGVNQSAAVVFDPSQLNISGLNSFTSYGGYGVDTVIHELGHVLGLGHAGPYNGDVDAETQQFGPYDSRQWSLMSYINPWQAAEYSASYTVTGTEWGTSADGYYREPTTWMPLDILAAQRLYGVATNTPLSGGQVFGFDCNIPAPIGQFFDFTVNTAPVVTLWDEGEDNTLNLSGFSAPAVVDLRPGAFSSVDGMTNDIGIAFGTSIDTVIGGTGDTTYVLNAQSDSVVGGGGNDTVEYEGSGANFTDTYAGPSQTLDGSGVDDTLVNIAALEFLGGANTIASNVGGAITVAGGDNALFLGPATFQVQLGGADTLIAGQGYTVATAAGAAGSPGDLVFAEEGGLVFYGGASPDTVTGGAVTVFGGSGGVTAYGSGDLLVDGGAGYNIAASFGGSETVQAGAGGGLLVGGIAGNNHLNATGGPAIIFAGGSGDQIDLANAATDTVLMAGGPETVDATAASGQAVVYAGSGNDVLTGGSGADLFSAGSGNATLTGGSDLNAYIFGDGASGGIDVITNWDPARDYVFLIGYGASADAQAVASEVQSGGNTLVVLADHTQIWFLNTYGVARSSFV
jgi:serralysin